MSSIIVSLDYELFFGHKVGTVQKCLIEPTEALLKAVAPYDIRLVLFVDAGYLVKLQEESKRFPQLVEEYGCVKEQLTLLKDAGHDVQLHIHPHWEDSSYDGTQWCMDTTRYKLHDFSCEEIGSIVKRYKQALTDIVGDTVFAYRAGGWCMQPFEKIADALFDNGVWLDSTVYKDGLSDDEQRWFDFRNAPHKPNWRFNSDPCVEDKQGRFFEVPISACEISPLFFWKMAVMKKLGGEQHRSYGDGSAMSYGSNYYLQRLTRKTYSVASIDGLKAGFLEAAYSQYLKQGGENFNVIGHPKALTPYSIEQFRRFLDRHKEISSVTFQDLKRSDVESKVV